MSCDVGEVAERLENEQSLMFTVSRDFETIIVKMVNF